MRLTTQHHTPQRKDHTEYGHPLVPDFISHLPPHKRDGPSCPSTWSALDWHGLPQSLVLVHLSLLNVPPLQWVNPYLPSPAAAVPLQSPWLLSHVLPWITGSAPSWVSMEAITGKCDRQIPCTASLYYMLSRETVGQRSQCSIYFSMFSPYTISDP